MVNPVPVRTTDATRQAQQAQALAAAWQTELWRTFRWRVAVAWEGTSLVSRRDLVQELPPLAVGILPDLGCDRADGVGPAPSDRLPLLALPAPLVLAMLDRRLGGAGEWPRYARELSLLEAKAFTPLAGQLWVRLAEHLPGLAVSAEPAAPAAPPSVALTTARTYLARYPRMQVGVARFDWTWSERHCRVYCCVDESLVQEGATSSDFATLRVELATVSLILRDLVGLERGDVIRLPSSPTRPVTVYVQDRPRWLALAGQQNGRLAVQLLKDWNPQEDEQDEPPVAVANRD